MSSSRRVSVAFAFVSAVSAGAFVGISAAPGCGAQPCNSNNPNLPVTSLECPAGELCYLGECFPSCSAGQELAQDCNVDDDCDSARPNCIASGEKGRFCSACEGFEVCVPTLNICRDVSPVEYPEPPIPPLNMGPRPPYPLDGGSAELDGGIVQFPGIKQRADAGVNNPNQPSEVTVVGFWDIYEQVDLRGGQRLETSGTELHVFDVSGVGAGIKWRAEFVPPRIQQTFLSDELAMLPEDDPRRVFSLGACEVRDLTATSSVVAMRREIDLGDMTIDDLNAGEMPDTNAINGKLRAQFVPAPTSLYTVTREDNGPGKILVFSSLDPFNTLFATVTSPGEDGITDGPWPDWDTGEFRGFHVPFELEPLVPTEELLAARINVAIPPTTDLSFTWTLVRSGADNKERIVARVVGNRTELFCDDIEGSMGTGRMTIPVRALEEFIAREGNVAFTYQLIFERASAQAPLIIAPEGQLIDFGVRFRHSFLQSIRFGN